MWYVTHKFCVCLNSRQWRCGFPILIWCWRVTVINGSGVWHICVYISMSRHREQMWKVFSLLLNYTAQMAAMNLTISQARPDKYTQWRREKVSCFENKKTISTEVKSVSRINWLWCVAHAAWGSALFKIPAILGPDSPWPSSRRYRKWGINRLCETGQRTSSEFS